MRFTEKEFLEYLESKLSVEVCPMRIRQLEGKIFKIKMERRLPVTNPELILNPAKPAYMVRVQ